MMQLRLIVPDELGTTVRRVLDDSVGVAHVVDFPGAGVKPLGDVVICDVARESTDELICALRDCGLESGGGAIVLADSGVALSSYADEAERQAPGEGADAVVWAELSEDTYQDATISLTFLTFLSVATMLAACGVMLDSAILIVGAMAVGPEFGPLAGFCAALVQRQYRMLVRSLLALVLGFLVAMVLTWIFTEVMGALGLFTRAQFEGPRPATAFIWKPDAMSVVVAMLAGVAGMLSLTSASSSVLVGVAISVTTVPAAANAAVALRYGNVHQALGSFAQLFANLGGIAAAGTLTLVVQRLGWGALGRLSRQRARVDAQG